MTITIYFPKQAIKQLKKYNLMPHIYSVKIIVRSILKKNFVQASCTVSGLLLNLKVMINRRIQ